MLKASQQRFSLLWYVRDTEFEMFLRNYPSDNVSEPCKLVNRLGKVCSKSKAFVVDTASILPGNHCTDWKNRRKMTLDLSRTFPGRES
jgi:hypothetical protein